MKTSKIIAAVLVSLSIVACNSQKPIKVGDTVYSMPAKSTVDSVSYLLGIYNGNIIRSNNLGQDFNYSEMLKGVKAFLNAKGDDPQSEDFLKQFKMNPMIMGDVIQRYMSTLNPTIGEDGLEVAPQKAPKGAIDSVSYFLGVNFGSFLKMDGFGEKFNFKEMLKGTKDFVNAEGDPDSEDFLEQFKINPMEMNTLFNSYLDQIAAYNGAGAKQEEAEFLAENAKKPGFQTTESGLQYLITQEGTGVKPTALDTVTVFYKGTLPNGEVFDQTDDEPISFPLGNVIAGWTEGLQLIGEGGKITLVIPSELGYGVSGQGPIGPNTPLTFEVELVEVAPFDLESQLLGLE